MSDFNKANKLVVYNFFAHWCNPCKMQAPIIEKVEQKYINKVIFEKIDIDVQHEIVRKHNIMSVPTIIFLHDNVEVCKRLSGFTSEDSICAIIDNLLEKIGE